LRARTAAYAETFPVVGGDFSFYAIPEPAFWKKLFEDAPAHLKWSLKVPEHFTTKRFSNQLSVFLDRPVLVLPQVGLIAADAIISRTRLPGR